ncbi:hypothetical protein PILCRDRAFT_400913 [Piloderma croceum F 1598]|uniref:Uncharacterized protein n=1 Tax=Piloderma croceum (strain F 1598) TaxID=765440 RepID=A0A0C3C3K1_PILCF|nr:hypothetical protein PILCRDRAFT_400913 [Piloderma croceum F 1598]
MTCVAAFITNTIHGYFYTNSECYTVWDQTYGLLVCPYFVLFSRIGLRSRRDCPPSSAVVRHFNRWFIRSLHGQLSIGPTSMENMTDYNIKDLPERGILKLMNDLWHLV